MVLRAGELVAALGVSVTNDAPGAALNDTLTGSIGGASGPFTTAGNLGTGLLAGVTDTSSLGVELDTSAAGIFAGTAAASLFRFRLFRKLTTETDDFETAIV